MERTTLYLPEDLAARLRELAKRQRKPVAEIVREALQGYVATQGRPMPSSLGAGQDEELHGRETEDWLRARWADAAVVACTERHGGRVLTLDERHFRAIEREGRIHVLP